MSFKPRRKCRHCKQRLAERRGGLCRPCYGDQAIRKLYPAPLHKHAHRGLDCRGARIPAKPTDAAPGSLEKMRVMQQRIRRGEQLFHPQDASDVKLPLLNPFNGFGPYRSSEQDSGLEDEEDKDDD